MPKLALAYMWSCAVGIVVSITFGNRTTQLKIDYFQAFHLERDEYIESQLLLSTFDTISVVTEQWKMTSLAGLAYQTKGYSEKRNPKSTARFNRITGFVQTTNDTVVLLVDQENHCLRTLDRKTSLTQTLAGKCENSGQEDGGLLEARFNRPYTVIAGYYSKEYYVTDTDNYAIRLVSEATSQVTTIAKLVDKPHGIVLDRVGKQLLLVVGFTLQAISIEDGNGVQQLQVSGDFAFGLVKEILSLHPSWYLIAQIKSEDKLLLLNTNNMTMESVLSIKDFTPYTICLSRNKDMLYIGIEERIDVLSVQGIPEWNDTGSTVLTRPLTPTITSKKPPAVPLRNDNGKTGELSEKLTTYIVIGLVIIVIFMMAVVLVTLLKRRRRGQRRDCFVMREEETPLRHNSERSIDYRSTLFEPTQGSLAASSLTYECPMAIAPQPPIDSASRPIILRRDDEEDADDGSHAYEPVVVRKA